MKYVMLEWTGKHSVAAQWHCIKGVHKLVRMIKSQMLILMEDDLMKKMLPEVAFQAAEKANLSQPLPSEKAVKL